MKKMIFVLSFMLFCSVSFSYASGNAGTPDKTKVELSTKVDDISTVAPKEEGKKAKLKKAEKKASGCCSSKAATTGCTESQKKSCEASKKSCSETKSAPCKK